LTRRIIGVVFVVTSLAVSLGSPAQAESGHRSTSTHSRVPLIVKISRAHARIGADGSVPVVVFTRCRAGLNAFELDVSVRQGAVFGSATILGPGVTPCDGRWHRSSIKVSPDAGSFAAGPATADAFLGAFDPVEGDLDATDTATVILDPPLGAPAQVRVFWRGELNEAGEATLVVWARCRPPWAISGLSVELTQGADSGVGNTNDFGLPCDGQWLRRAVKVVPSPGSFEQGKSFASASFSILDLSTGDPVYTARFERHVWLVGSVAPVLWDQTGSRSGARVSADASDDTLDSQGADDFVVPAGQVWSITSVFAPGSNGSTHPPPFLVPGVNIFIYEDGGSSPGALVASYVGVVTTTVPDDLTVPLSPALMLRPGTYWISVQADVSSLGSGNGWLWAVRQDPTGATGVWRNPGGGFGGGAEDWTPFQDLEFDLRGTSASA
jgi:hypothetical protein